MGEIYKITCKTTGMSYIGQTQRGTERRWIQHVWNSKNDHHSAISKIINKYGENDFTQEILTICEICDLDKNEIEAIEKHGTLFPFGYNMVKGGGAPTIEVREKMSEAAKIRPINYPPRTHEEDKVLPDNIIVVRNKAGVNIGYRVEFKAKKINKAFKSLKLSDAEKLNLAKAFRQDVLDGKIAETVKPPRTLPKYIYKVKNGYKISVDNNCIRTFQCKKNTMEQNLQFATEHLAEMTAAGRINPKVNKTYAKLLPRNTHIQLIAETAELAPLEPERQIAETVLVNQTQ